jgi:hypothetical protein
MSQKLTIEHFDVVPARVQAAMSYVQHCMWLTDPINFCGVQQGRPLTGAEQAAYQAALDALRLYFVGEMDFGGAPMRLPEVTPKEPKKKDRHKNRCTDGEE